MKESIHIQYSNRMGDSFRNPFFLIMIFLLPFFVVKSQTLEVGLNLGGSYYLGDLNPGKHFLNTDIAYGLVARYNMDTRWAVKISGQRGNLKGSSSASTFLQDGGLDFTSKLTDISGVVEFNFLSYFIGSRMNKISPYIYGGISVFFFDPVSKGISLRSMGTEGQNTGYQGRKPYGSVSVSIPFGLGAKMNLARRLGLQVYWEMHKTFNDYLDDVSTTYYLDGQASPAGDQAAIMSDPTLSHEPGMQRGNASNKDWYAFFGVAVTYKFNLLSSKKCRDLSY
ncbi:MAG: DUF6089 family protein [Bacteroidetes bacterium]|nr:DUF6089 family protein [Bacteroidota bacterium]